MQVIIVFEQNLATNTFYVAGVADHQRGADNIAAMSLAKGKGYRAYTDTYSFTGSLDRDCYVVYVRNNWLDESVRERDDDRKVFKKMFITGEKASGADIKIYKSEDSALSKMDTIVDDLVPADYEHRGDCEAACAHIRLNTAQV